MNTASKENIILELILAPGHIDSIESQNDALHGYLLHLKSHNIEFKIVKEATNSLYFNYDGELSLVDQDKAHVLKLDWARDLKTHLSRKYALTKEPLFKALKLKGDGFASNFLVDASLGTGKDACLLLSFGCHLMCFERNPHVFALALWAYQKAVNYKDSAIGDIFKNHFSLHFGQAIDADVIDNRFNKCFFDPMYEMPSNKKAKSALSRKEMEVFKNLVGKDEDQDQYLASLLEQFSLVCLKRPIKARTIELTQSKYQMVSFSGKSTRYDRYFLP